MKRIGIVFISMAIMNCSFAQTVFTYSTKAVTKDEFVKAFNKNPIVSSDRKKALEEYLDLYIKFKLKVQAAYDAGLNKDATQEIELQNFRKQIADNIINEQANLKALVEEAFEHSQKEIHLAQVFIEVPGNADKAEAYKNIHTAYKQLQEGKDFAAVSQEFSTDEITKQSKGDIGFITAFTLPYYLETVAYSLPVNSFSAPVKSKAGYHIFKNTGERKPLGSRRVAQILIAFPPDASAAEKNIASRKADSVYNLLLKKTDFEGLVINVSNDLSSSNNGGELPEFTAGTYSADFEQVAFSLKKAGDFSKPFQTSYGFHILRLLEIKPVATDLNDPGVLADFQERVTKDSRMDRSKKDLLEKKLTLVKYKPAKYNEKDLYTFTDSAVLNPNFQKIKGINKNTLLFSFAKQNIKARDWIDFVKNARNAPDQNSKDNYGELFKEFIQVTTDEYYRKNLEDYNPGFSKQIKEFKEANLLFGIMEKNVWNKANADTAGLIQYYNLHKSKYIWPPSADAVIVTCKTLTLAEDIQKNLKDNFSSWRQITGNNGSDVVADSSRFELGQLTVAERTHFTPGLLTLPVKNADGIYTFNYVIHVYQEPAQRTFEDVRGLVISDYQQAVEDKWIEELKKKYPVKVNEVVFRSIK